MSAKKLFVATVITALLTGCGGNNGTQAGLPVDSGDTTYASNDGSSSADLSTDTSSTQDPANPTPADDTASPLPDATGTSPTTPTTGTTAGATLKGLVIDANGKPVVGASVTIGAQTVLTDANGNYAISGINDSKVFVNVTMTGYDPVNQVAVTLSGGSATVTQDFKLVLKGGTSNGGTTTPSASGLKHEMAFASTKFKSVAAMVVADNHAYVLGVINGLLFDSTAVVSFDASNGEVTNTFKKIGFLRSLPKDASRLKVDGDNISVSNGTTHYNFSLSGNFLTSSSGGAYDLITSVTDSDRSITYKIHSATTVDVTYKGTTTNYKLDEVSNAKALGLDSDGHLLVLDSSALTVQQFSFNP